MEAGSMALGTVAVSEEEIKRIYLLHFETLSSVCFKI